MQEPGERPPLRLVHHGFEPFGLLALGRAAAAEQQRIEADQPPAGDVAHPAVETEMPPPAVDPLVIDRLMRIAGVADVVIAGQREQRDAEGAHQLRAMRRIGLLVGRIDRHVAGVDDQIGPPRPQRCGYRLPIGSEMPLARAEVSIGNLNDANHGRLVCGPPA
jgi:hypothetical protein